MSMETIRPRPGATSGESVTLCLSPELLEDMLAPLLRSTKLQQRYRYDRRVGLSPQIAQTVPHGIKKLFGRAGYLAWATLQFAKFHPFELVVTQGEMVQRLTATEVLLPARGAKSMA